MIMKTALLLSYFLTIAGISTAQNSEAPSSRQMMDSLKAIDWLQYDYEQLDENHKILTNSTQFEKWKKNFNYKDGQILNYRDSLSVVLNQELDNGNAARIAILRLSYTWDRASWSLLLPADSVQTIAHQKNFKYPYQFVTDLRENPKDSVNRMLIRQLKSRLKELNLDKPLQGLDSNGLMKLAFQYSPGRLKVVDSILANQGSARRND
jgi:hypothetical protein